jgi:hypothetical protein
MTIAIPTIGTRISVATFGSPVATAINDHETRLTAAELITTPAAAVWTNYTPTYGNLVINNGVVISRYKQIGKIVHYRWKLTWGTTTTSGGGFWTISMPVVALDLGFTGGAYVTDSGVGQRSGAVVALTTSAFAVVVASTLVAGTTVPITWTTGDEILVEITYEAA